MSDALQREIERLTLGVVCLRTVHQLIYKKEIDMGARLIEIKGLGADVASVKKGIGDLRVAAAELNTQSSGLKAEIGDLTDQIKQHRADLRFEAETLGNGPGGEDEKKTEVTGSGDSSTEFQTDAKTG